MAPTLYLHLGIHKTGTSAIQNTCMANRSRLMHAGILFPITGFTRSPAADETVTSGHRRLIRFMEQPWRSPASRVGRDLLGEMDASPWDRIVISSEVFSAPHAKGAVKGISWFQQRGFEVKVVAYLRRQDAWLDSFYRERLKWGGNRETRSLEEFWLAEGNDWLDYQTRLGAWVDAVGQENAVIRSYEDVQEAGGVVPDFLQVIGADQRLLDMSRSTDVHYPSLPPSAVELLRAFNQLPQFGEGRNSDLISAVRRMELFNRSRGSLISPTLWRELKSAYGARNEELRRTWVSGPSERLSFETNIEPAQVAEQAISHADSVLLIAGMSRAFARRSRESRRVISTPRGPAAKNSFGTVTTCRENPKQVCEFVNYHLNLGAACMVIYFDDPTDPAMRLFEDEARVVCRACDPAHWHALLGGLPASTGEAQTANIDHGASILRDRGVGWIAPIDADELLYSWDPFTEVLAAIDPNVDVVSARPIEAIQHTGMRKGLEFQSAYFRDFPAVLTPAQQRISELHTQRVIEFGEAGRFGNLIGKSLFRADAEIGSYGVHTPRRGKKKLKKIVLDDIVVLHFDAMNYQSWEQKWTRRFTGEATFGMSEHRWNQYHHLKRVYEAGGSAAMQRVFGEWHSYSPAAVAALRRAQLLRRVRIPASSFSGPVEMRQARNNGI